MKISILGANSYIARNMAFMLCHKAGYKGSIELYLYDCQASHLDGMKEYQQINIFDMDSVRQVKTDVDIIFYFIGKTGTGQGFTDYKNFIDVNEAALLNILSEYVQKASHARIVFPSTRLVYKGKHGKLREDDKKAFHTVYAVNKYACEQYLKMYGRVFGITYTVFRICVPYATAVSGASSYGTAEFMLKKAQNGEDIQLYGKGDVRRTLTHIEDLCEILFKGAASAECRNDIYNVGGEDYSLLEMAARIAEKYAVGIQHIEWPQQAWKTESGDTVFDSGRLDSILKYQYRHTFQNWLEHI